MESGELRAKFKRRKIHIPMSSKESSWPPPRDPKDVSRSSGSKRIYGPAPEEEVRRDKLPFKEHCKRHAQFVKTVEAGDWWR